MKVLDLFSGIGGFALGLEAAGFKTAAFCEIDDYAQKVLKKNWPGVPIYDDVRRITADRLISDGIEVDVITGGFPCQDISVAGSQKGIHAERSGLWSECARLLGDVRPRYAIFENVTNLLTGDGGDWFKRVLWDISSVGYDAEWHCIPASAIGAHHHRDRVRIVAYPNVCKQPIGLDASELERVLPAKAKRSGPLSSTSSLSRSADANSKRGCGGNAGGQYEINAGKPPICERRIIRAVANWDIEPNVGRVANGVPSRSHRLKCLGNAVVPQIPELIGRQIMEAERGRP